MLEVLGSVLLVLFCAVIVWLSVSYVPQVVAKRKKEAFDKLPDGIYAVEIAHSVGRPEHMGRWVFCKYKGKKIRIEVVQSLGRDYQSMLGLPVVGRLRVEDGPAFYPDRKDAKIDEICTALLEFVHNYIQQNARLGDWVQKEELNKRIQEKAVGTLNNVSERALSQAESKPVLSARALSPSEDPRNITYVSS